MSAYARVRGGDGVTVVEFETLYPQFAIDRSRLIREQGRIFDCEELAVLPDELEPVARRQVSTKGFISRNETRSHHQCRRCGRVRRNDMFRHNRQSNWWIQSYCRDCLKLYADAYTVSIAESSRIRRVAVWRYLAPHGCALCGWNQSIYGIDMHHCGDKDGQISTLVTGVANCRHPSRRHLANLVREASKCIPLCACCHRMVHAGEVDVSNIAPLQYNERSLMKAIRQVESVIQFEIFVEAEL